MSITELPPLTDRSRTLSGSSSYKARNNRKHSGSSLLELASRSPHSFSSSSVNSHLSGNQQKKSLKTLFEQKLVDINRNSKKNSVVDEGSLVSSRARSHSQDTGSNTRIMRGKLNRVLTNSNATTLTVTNNVQSFKKPPFKRFNSESNIFVEQKNCRNVKVNMDQRRISVTKNDFLTTISRKNYSSNDSIGNTKNRGAKSNRRMPTSIDRIYPLVRDYDDDNADDDTESDDGLNDRVYQWLAEVDREAEVPPEPQFVYEDTPPQTDSAIHIVYEES